MIQYISKIGIIIFILILPFTLRATEGDTTAFRKIVVHSLKNSRDVALSPRTWDRNDLLAIGGASAVAATSVFYFDKPISTFFSSHHTSGWTQFFNTMEPMGDFYPIGAMACFALHGIIKKDNYSVETATIVAQSMILNTIAVQSVKHLIGRQRPDAASDSDPLKWEGPGHGVSFYSGHTSTAFSVASVIAWRYRDTHWVPWVSYGLASLGGMQRIYQNRHWTSDVVFGAFVGTSIGLFLAKNSENNPLKIYPFVSPSVNGFSMVFPIGQ